MDSLSNNYYPASGMFWQLEFRVHHSIIIVTIASSSSAVGVVQ